MILEKLRNIKEDYYELSKRFCGEDWCSNLIVVKNGIDQVKKYGMVAEDKYYSFSYCSIFVAVCVERFCRLIDEILEHKEELLPSEFEMLSNIRFSDIFEKTKSEDFLLEPFEEKDIKDVLEKLREENLRVNSLYNSMENRVFCPNRNNK